MCRVGKEELELLATSCNFRIGLHGIGMRDRIAAVGLCTDQSELANTNAKL